MTGNDAVKHVVDERTKKMREAIDYDVKHKNEIIIGQLPESAKKHMRHRPYALDWI